MLSLLPTHLTQLVLGVLTASKSRLMVVAKVPALHAVGLGFESLVAHFSLPRFWLLVPPYEQNAIVCIGQISNDQLNVFR